MKNVTQMISAVLVIFVGLQAFAEDPQINGKKHPRRKEVISRAEHQKMKNNEAASEGKITKAQAEKLNRQDNRIERQEQVEAKANGGYLTKGEQRQFNREENKVSKERETMEKKDAAAGPTSPSSSN